MKLIGILIEDENGTRTVVRKTYGLILSDDPRLNKPLPLEQIGVRHRAVLEGAGISTFRDVLEHDEAALLRLPEFGRRGLHYLEEILHEEGLRLSNTIVKIEGG